VLAEYLLSHPEWVKGRCVVDVGPGSGVVAIAAALAGAARVIACDLDQDALTATALNGAENRVEIELSQDLDTALAAADLVTAADILYDRENLPLLARFQQAAQVLLADSRVPDLHLAGSGGIQRVQRGESVCLGTVALKQCQKNSTALLSAPSGHCIRCMVVGRSPLAISFLIVFSAQEERRC
jgi:SAM-dependent methyltransferase